MSSVTVPRALFFGRRRRAANTNVDGAADRPEYEPPPPVIPLSTTSYKLHTPALLHAFYAHRIESGHPIDKDDPFDQVHASIGPLGQIVVKPVPGSTPAKKAGKKEGEGAKKKVKK
jgi:transcriptional activator SPT7